MDILKLEINKQIILDEANKIDWGKVKNTPLINITSNAHTHDDRYYRQSDVDSRINSLSLAIADLEEKVNNLGV